MRLGYKCDLCGCEILDKKEVAGIWYAGLGFRGTRRVVPLWDAKKHLCNQCVSTIQEAPLRCGQGFSHGNKPVHTGGAYCSSDHK